MNYSVKTKSIKYWLLLILCFFPFLNLLRLPTDTQPNALLLSIPILLISLRKKFPSYYLLGFFLFLVAFIMLLLSKLDFGAILSFSNYVSVFIVPLAVFFTLKFFNGLSYDFFKKVIYIWGFVGLVQKLFYSSFLSFLLSRSSEGGVSSGRGVVSLAPEPTYYGSVIILFIVVYFLNFSEKKDYRLLLILLIQLVALSVSSTAILVLLVAAGVYFFLVFMNLPIKRILMVMGFFLALVLAITLITPLFSGSRVYTLVNMVISKPELILLDQSISERFNAIYFSIGSLFHNYGIPNGFNTFKDYVWLQSQDPNNAKFFFNYRIESYTRILSGFGMGIFELGIFGLLIPFLIFISIWRSLKIPTILFAYVLFNLLMFTAMSLNNALILFIIGNMIYITNREKTTDDLNLSDKI
ncbi:MAG: hypothetical protein ABIP95_09865 [Pelobium sp.]